MPLRSASDTGLPSTSLPAIGGAGLPTRSEPGHAVLEVVLHRAGCIRRAGQVTQLAGDVVSAVADQALEVRLADGQRELGIGRLRGFPGCVSPVKEDFQVSERPIMIAGLRTAEHLYQGGHRGTSRPVELVARHP